MRYPITLAAAGTLAVLFALVPQAEAQRFEFGGGAGGSFYKNATVSSGAGDAKAGFGPGFAATVYVGQNLYDRLSGEVRYSYAHNGMKLKGDAAQATFGARSHMLHYDVVYHGAPAEARVRTFVFGGGGLKGYQGTGTEAAYQPLQSYALLTKTSQWMPMVTFGAGVKLRFGNKMLLRVEFRDYVTQFPKDVIAPVPGAKVGGWLHNFMPMVGLSILL